MKDRIIVALDVDSRARALELVETLRGEVSWFKVGMELFSAEGPGIVKELTAMGARIFVDLKYHDIPNTAASACAALVGTGAAMFNVHCSGGREMLQRSMEKTRDAAARLGVEVPRLIGVTVLTSMSQEVLTGEIGVQREMGEQVRAMAVLAREAGLDGVVASPREIEIIRQACGPDFLIVTPGVRPVWAAKNDQSRVMTPAEAYRAGASQLVIGRPITGASDPKEACRRIIAEMEGNV